MQIWNVKLPLCSNDTTRSIPLDAKFVKVGPQIVDGDQVVTVWFTTSGNASEVTREFQVVPTGCAFNDAANEYVGSATMFDGFHTFHVIVDK